MLKLERVSKYYFSGNNVVQALRRINLECKIGEFIAITGESGSGKSTLLNVLSGLDTYEEGKLYFNGQDISHYTIEELEHYRKDYIGYVFQEYNIIDSYTVYQNIELALTIQGYTKEQKRRRTLELIDQTGLTLVANQKASMLSGGEKQRTVIARTLAKDYQILVCDEPTGNLNEEAAHGIFALLREISKEKLVIVVTHDITLIQEYASRKIRLYDGEIVEDAQLANPTSVISQEIAPKESNTSLSGSMEISLKNITSVPKKSLFAFLTVIFMLAMIFFVYSAGVVEVNRAYTSDNPYFINANPSRIILVKDDKTPFSVDEMLEIGELDKVRGVFNNDIVFDSELVTKKYNESTLWNDFYHYKPLPAIALDDRDLIEGRFPQTAYEVVLGNIDVFKIGDEIHVANSYKLIESQSLLTDQFTFTVVGFVEEPIVLKNEMHYFYLSDAGLRRLSSSSIHESSEIQLHIEGTEKYVMATDTWITPEIDETVDVGSRTYGVSYTTWVSIDDSLSDGEILTFDMMYFNFCRDFGYKKEIRDDLDAGLCEVSDFVDSHVFTYRAITPFENDKPFELITLTSAASTSDDQSLKLYMNEATFQYFFGEENYQITVIVRDSFEGKQVVKDLEELGYKVFYPAEVIDRAEAIDIVVRNIIVILIVAVIIASIFFVGYFVLHKLIFSKLKDYLIIRSIGTPKKAVKRIIRSEIFLIAFIAMLLIVGFLIVSEYYIYAIPEVIRYFKWFDYLVLIGLVLIVLELMVIQFTRKIFKASVISALKGAER